jgi:antitoxin VapB
MIDIKQSLEAHMETAKVFKTGRSQAVRIPKSFRFHTSTVGIRRQGESIILTPRREISWDDFFQNHTCSDFEPDREAAQTTQERDVL